MKSINTMGASNVSYIVVAEKKIKINSSKAPNLCKIKQIKVTTATHRQHLM